MHTEFYCRQSGSNLNAGSSDADASTLTYASGSWVAATGVFTVASGNPTSDGVAVGNFVSVYANGSTTTGFVGRVTARDATTITVSLTAVAGTPPTDGSGTRTLKVGGAWAKPSGSTVFPFAFVTPTLMNSSNHTTRVNFKDDSESNITSTVTSNIQGPITFEGYTSTPGDGGRFWIDGGTTGTSFVLLANTQNYNRFINLGLKNNGDSGTARDGFTNTGNSVILYGLIAHSIRRTAIQTQGNTSAKLLEVYNANQSNTVNQGGYSFATAGSSLERCVVHNMRNGSNGNGFILDTSLNFIMCMSVYNQGHGVISNGDTNQNYYFSDFSFNGGNGFNFAGGSQVMQSSFSGCNFIGNTGYGIAFRPQGHSGAIINCGFGAGTMANGLGNFSYSEPWAMKEINNFSYPADTTPYRDYLNGDFTIVSSSSINQGPGTFSMTKSGYGGTVGYPDVGAGQHLESAGGAGLMWGNMSKKKRKIKETLLKKS